MDEAGGQGPSNRAEDINASDHASVQIGNNNYSKTFHGGIHNHVGGEVTRDSVLRDLASHSYRERKDINPDRVPNTCEWFLSHKRYKQWRQHPASSMLRVSADPGCGKSVLAKYLTDKELQTTGTTTTCYFFFKDGLGDQNSATTALRCILHQILLQRADLFSDQILKRFQQRSYLMTSTVELWELIIKLSSESVAGEFILILDAFDECSREGRSELERLICQFYGKESSDVSLKLLITSRPHENVIRGFRGMEISDLPVLHLAGEDEDETELIAKEIDLVIAARIKELSLRLDLSTDDAEHLRIRLSGFNNRTYLWVHLTMNVIENADRTSRGGISSIIEQLPKSVYDAYEKILDRSSDSLRARKLLEIMLAATRPLGLFEIAIALDINEAHKTHLELEVPPEHKVVRYLRDLCGLFIVVINAEIFFLHQTAREFLMRDEEKPSLGASKKQTPSSITKNNSMDSELWNWAQTITRKEAHRTLGKLCVAYLLLRDFIDDTTLGRKHHVESPRSIQEGIAFPFLQYASRNWYLHCREAGFDSNLTGPMMQLCGYSGGWGCDSGPTSMAWTYEHNEGDMKIRRLSPLMIAARFGVTPVARSILTDRPYAAKEVDTRTGRSALSFSSEQGFIDIVELLLTYLYSRVRRSMGLTRKHVDNIAKSGQTPLSFAALNGHTTVARLLLKCGARAEHKDIFNGTPLSYGLCSEDEAMVALVLNGSEAMGPKDLDDTLLTILCYALVRDQGRIITRMIGTNRVEATAMLSLEFVNDTTVALDRFAVSLMSDQGLSGPRTVKLKPFTVAELAVCVASRTFFRAFEAIGKAVDVRHSDQWGTTLLHWAAVHTQASDGILEDLVSKGALIDAMEDRAGCTPLHWALWARKSDTAELLLSFGADVHKRSQDGRSAFKMGNWSHTAAFMLCGNVSIPGLENIHGADRSRLKDFIIVERDGNPSRMFDFAFLERSRYWDAAFDQNPDFGLSNLIAVVASLKGEYDVLESLVRGGVSLQFQNIQGQTLLHERQSIRQASLLLDHPIDPNIQDDQGRTALHEVISRGSHLWSTLDLDMVTLLLNHGASPNIQDHSGAAALHEVLRCRLSRDQPAQTALRERAHCLEIVKLLLDNSAYVDLQDGEGRSALHIAASCGVAPVVIRLLEAYADVGLSDDKGNTPLHYASSNGHQDVGDVLLGFGASLGMLNDAGEPPIAHGVGYGKSGKFRLRKRVDGLRGS